VVKSGQQELLHGLRKRGARVIIAPKLATAKMTRRVTDEGPRHINKMTSRVMLAWRHGEGRGMMGGILRYFPDVRVLHSTEHYTSKGK
jgi:hypothetical protein